MRHQNSRRRLGVPEHRRKALLKNLATALFLQGRIRTTITRAKETRSVVERIITWAKRGGLHHRRLAQGVISRHDIVGRIFSEMAVWYKNRPGGYTRIVRLGNRPGDAAPMALLELVDWVEGEKLPGQHAKVVKPVEGEEGDPEKPAEKEKKKAPKEKAAGKEKGKKAKPSKVKTEKKSKDPEKEKKIEARKAEQEKQKQERASLREKKKQTRQAQKSEHKAALPSKGKKMQSRGSQRGK